MKYATTGFDRVNAKFNAELSADFREWMHKHQADVKNIGVIKSTSKFTKKGFIESL